MNSLDVINKGVPIETPIVIRVSDLYAMTNNKERLAKKLDKEFKKYTEFLSSLSEKNDIEIFMTLCIGSDKKTLEKKLHFAPTGFISTILNNLNVDNICNIRPKHIAYNDVDSYNNDYASKIEDRIRKLKLVTSEKNLRKHFPVLYIKYTETKELYKNLKEIEEVINSPKVPFMERIKLKADLNKTYQNNNLNMTIDDIFEMIKDFSINKFCISYAKTFEGLVEHFADVLEYLETHSLDIDDLGIEPEKLELYIANASMKMCEDQFVVDKQRYIYYIANYFKTDKERKYSEEPIIEVGVQNNEKLGYFSKGEEVCPRKLYTRYRKFLSENPDIHVFDFSNFDFNGMNLAEVELFLEEYIKELQANWEILPEEQLDSDIVRVVNKSGKGLTEEEKTKYREHLLDLLVEKKELYGSTDPFFRIKGKDTFDGYVGFIYPNGKVVLDKFYENYEIGKVAEGQAIYVMDIEDFYKLSHFSKRELIADSRVKRIVHNGAWQDRVLEVINSGEQKHSTANEIKKLIKSKEVKKED